jgi:glutaredoxin
VTPPRAGEPGARVVLYSKPGCHLCEDMRAIVDDVLEGSGVAVREVDITQDAALFARFQYDIPVLEIDGEEVARHRIAEPALVKALRAAGAI